MQNHKTGAPLHVLPTRGNLDTRMGRPAGQAPSSGPAKRNAQGIADLNKLDDQNTLRNVDEAYYHGPKKEPVHGTPNFMTRPPEGPPRQPDRMIQVPPDAGQTAQQKSLPAAIAPATASGPKTIDLVKEPAEVWSDRIVAATSTGARVTVLVG